MCRIDEEVNLLIGNFPLLFHNKNAQYDDSDKRNQNGIQYHCPGGQPERLGDDNINAPFFEHDSLVFIRDGPYPQNIFSRSKVGIANRTFIAGLAPFLVESFQFPGIKDV